MDYGRDLVQTTNRETSQVERFMLAVYVWMAVGLAVTALAAFQVASSPAGRGLLRAGPAVFVGLLMAELVLVKVLSSRARTMAAFAAGATFLLYALLTGVTLSVVVITTTATTLTQAFVGVSGLFLVMTTFGVCTKRSLSGWTDFLTVGLIGVLIASVANLLVGSALVEWVTSLASIVVFTGLTAHDTQQLRDAAREPGFEARPIHGALILYLDFLNLFLALVNIIGSAEE